MQISTEVMNVLERLQLDGLRVRIAEKLDRPLYEQVNKVLDSIGGKWTRSVKAHVFDGDAAELLEDILQTGEYHRVKQDLGQFDSPPAVVARVIELCHLRAGMRFLEPSAGIGNIALEAVMRGCTVFTVELDPKRMDKMLSRSDQRLNGKEVYPGYGDFLQQRPDGWGPMDVVGMNPPFAKQVDIDHVYHASKFLKPGGRLVSVMSASVTFRQNNKTALFREWVKARGGTIELLEPGAFAQSGTQVRACIVSLTM